MASWVEKVKQQFSITTGDGKVYTPFSFNANRAVEYNVAEFDFRNLSGTLVEKRMPRGMVYNLDLYFNGGDNLDKAKAFQLSGNNRNPWTIQHPFYGKLVVQPISPVYYDNANNLLNATRITVTVRETISKAALTNVKSANDVIATNQVSTAQHYAAYYVNIVPAPKVVDVLQMKADLNLIQRVLKTASAGAALINNAINAANAAINHAITDVSNAISTIQSLITLPATIIDSVANRTAYLNGIYNSLASGLALRIELNKVIPVSLKALFFTEGGTAVSAMCMASITNITATDYAYSAQVLKVIAQVTAAYNDYLLRLDQMQTYNGSMPDSWIADPTSVIALDNLVNYTLQTLFNIQANSKQAKTITLTRDSNVIEIAWQIYGLLPDDSTIDQIRADNNIGMNELLQVQKGRQILYYA